MNVKNVYAAVFVSLVVSFVGAVGCGPTDSAAPPHTTEEPTSSTNSDPTKKKPDDKVDNPDDDKPVKPRRRNECYIDAKCGGVGHYCVKTDLGRRCIELKKRPDGEPCDSDDQCAGGICKKGEWKDGYCTQIGCSTVDDCNNVGKRKNNRCFHPLEGENYCARTCFETSECREGYSCQHSSSDTYGVCEPIKEVELPFFSNDNSLDATCVEATPNREMTIRLDLPRGTTNYVIEGWLDGGEGGGLEGIELRSGSSSYSVLGQNYVHRTQSIMGPLRYLDLWLGKANPFVQDGPLDVVVKPSGSGRVCLKLFAEGTPGNIIDVNVYLVGLDGLTSENIEENSDIRNMFHEVDKLYNQIGFRLGKIRYQDVDEGLAKKFRIIRDSEDHGGSVELIRSSKVPGQTRQEQLSLNVFLVQSIIGSALGWSFGTPGRVGIHGTSASGVLLQIEKLGLKEPDGSDGTKFTGQVMAHEVGHFLGLNHTTEEDGESEDGLSDTPRCSVSDMTNESSRCPDVSNLMFPYAAGGTELSDQQRELVAENPLTKE